jgi:hypothetical protein
LVWKIFDLTLLEVRAWVELEVTNWLRVGVKFGGCLRLPFGEGPAFILGSTLEFLIEGGIFLD